jgi:secreted trypsin-like serine protease
MKRLLLAASLTILQISATISPANALMNGQNALGDERVVAITRGGDAQMHCSGALLAPRLVATAAHCVLRVGGGVANPEKLIYGDISQYKTLWVAAPGVEVPKGGTSNAARVIAQFPAENYSDAGCIGTDCNASLGDIAILVLDKPLSSKTFRFATSKEIAEMKRIATEVLSIAYGTKNEQDQKNANVGIGRDGKPTKSEAATRTNFCCAGKKVEQRSLENPSEIVQTLLAKNVFHGGGDSGSPLWVNIEDEWVYVGALSAGSGPMAELPPSSPRWTDAFELSVAGGVYYTLAGHRYVYERAEKFLSTAIEADAKAAVELKAKQEADAKAAAELKAKQEADAKAAAELKAKQEADAKAAAELKAKQEADAKAAADKAAGEKIISDAKAQAARILAAAKAAAANKKVTIACIKGKLIKKVTAVKPVCPAGYNKKA